MTEQQSSPAEAKRDRRREARQVRQHAARRARRIRVIGGFFGLAALVTLIVIGAISIVRGPESGSQDRLRIPDEGRKHVEEGSDVLYAANPPASGDHYPIWSPYGIFREPVSPGYWVHNLEHGAIVLLYSCDTDCSQVVTEINQVYTTLPDGAFGEVKLVATPFEGQLETRFMLIAWNWQEGFNTVEADRIERFYRDFLDRGPERAP
jgi:hypothetical protein